MLDIGAQVSFAAFPTKAIKNGRVVAFIPRRESVYDCWHHKHMEGHEKEEMTFNRYLKFSPLISRMRDRYIVEVFEDGDNYYYAPPACTVKDESNVFNLSQK